MKYLKKNWKILSLLLLIFLIGLFFRAYNLDARGLSTDETEKMLAAKEYLNFRFFDDVEHPMIMKEMCAISIFIFGESETTLRLPNAIFGALTCVPIYLVGKILYNKKIGILSALLWAINISAIAFNRSAKEDTLMIFFGLFFVYYGLKADENEKYYFPAGMFLALTFASKYISFPLFLFWFIFTYIKFNKNLQSPVTFKIKTWLNKILLPFSLTFLIVNPIFLFPKFWQELYELSTIRYSDHTGYFLMGNMKDSLPIYYIPLYFLVKSSIIFLIFFTIGIIIILKRHNESDNFLLLWGIIICLAFSLPVFFTRFTRYVMPILPGIVIAQALGMFAIFKYLLKKFSEKSSINSKKSGIISFVVILIILIHPISILFLQTPYYDLYVNEIGGGKEKEGYYFPHCSYYDWGMREAVWYLNDNAENGSSLALIEDKVAKFYANKSFNYFSMQTLPENITSWKNDYNISYIVVQKYRIYYENIDKISELEINYVPEHIIYVNEKEVIQIYKF